MDRGRIKLFLTDKLATGLRARTVLHIQAVLRTMLNAAMEDGVIASNPAAKLGRTLKLNLSRATTQEEIKAMTQSQRHLFLATALRVAPRYYPLFFGLAGTGMRLGEGLALQPEDADYSGRTIRIVRAFSEDGALETPKSGHGRTVDLSEALVDVLRAHDRTRKQDALKYGWVALPPWTFVTKAGTPVNPANVRRAMLRVLKAAGLPQHFTPHCLRHTYASLLLADGVSPVYVQEQLGHATIELTVSTYGRWSLLSFLVIEDLRLNGIRQKQVVFTQHLGIGHTLDLILLTKLLSMLLMSPALPHGNNIFGPHITLPRKGKCLMSC